MRAVDIIRKKRDGLSLTREEIEAFVQGVTQRSWPEYQAASLLMAIYLRGMSAEETGHLTGAMVRSGATLDLGDLPGPKVDKHSTGGVGDKTSLILAPLAAACGVIVPMMSGRGLGHTGGTLDKLEAIPGFRVNLSVDEFRQALRCCGCAMIGQTAQVAPADKILYALRDVTGTVESIPLITASIMSKKIAEGIGGLVLDVKCGHGAFMKSRADARALAQALVATGQNNGVKSSALLTAMDAPLGRTVGNALEVQECLDTLRGRGPKDLESLSLTLAAWMLVLGGVAESLDAADEKVQAALASGRGLEKLREIIAEQGGDPHVADDPGKLPASPHQTFVRAKRSGYVTAVQAESVGRACILLGAGRNRVEDAVDHAVGVVIHTGLGEAAREGGILAEVHYRDQATLGPVLELLTSAWTIGDAPPEKSSLILETYRGAPA